jgi:cytochrome c peroxidase
MLTAPLFAKDDHDGRGHYGNRLPNMFSSENNHGKDATFSTAGFIDLDNPFFKSIGTNGRSCASCHAPDQGWTITPKAVKKLFDKTKGLDPLFRLVDGANSPLADVTTVDKRRTAYSMLIKKANIRVGIGIPSDAEFELIEADDPYGFASETELSLFRRPMPTTNLKFLSAIMWDGRETTLQPGSSDCIYGAPTCFSPVSFDLGTQANHATRGHAEALRDLTDEERNAIVAFESGLFTAQIEDNEAGALTAENAYGGPKAYAREKYYFGINDTLAGDYKTHVPFNPNAMSLYDSWNRYNTSKSPHSTRSARAAIARGQALFNSKPIVITGVKGINDDLGVSELAGTCTTCHNTPNSGNHSTPMPLDIGVADASRRTPDMPLYTLKNKTTGEIVKTTDPGRALLTGKWKDIGRFKGPILRAVASRPPYFHDGSAADLQSVVEFYNTRFNIGLTESEKADLVAFLAAL